MKTVFLRKELVRNMKVQMRIYIQLAFATKSREYLRDAVSVASAMKDIGILSFDKYYWLMKKILFIKLE